LFEVICYGYDAFPNYILAENKFAVGSGAKTVCICYYEQDNNWFVNVSMHFISLVI